MIVMSRRRDEQIVIGDDIIVTVADIRGDRVRLCIESPSGATVHRAEVWQAIQRNKDQQTTNPELPPTK